MGGGITVHGLRVRVCEGARVQILGMDLELELELELGLEQVKVKVR